jgi:hypothetical protein
MLDMPLAVTSVVMVIARRKHIKAFVLRFGQEVIDLLTRERLTVFA